MTGVKVMSRKENSKKPSSFLPQTQKLNSFNVNISCQYNILLVDLSLVYRGHNSMKRRKDTVE